MKSVVLLKDGTVEIVQCPHEAVFILARIRNAGICGVFFTRKQAEDYIERMFPVEIVDKFRQMSRG